MSKRIVIIAVLFCLLCAVGIAGAKTDPVYTQSKNGVIFDKNIDTTKIKVEKLDKAIKISSDEHAETTIKIKKSDIEALGNFTGSLKISHFTDEGVNDWTKVVSPDNNNGYFELDVEFSSVTLTVITSPINNWNFEAFTGNDPDSWTVMSAGGAKTVDAYVSSYAYKITGGAGYRGSIMQPVTLAANTEYTFGVWVKTSGVTSGYSYIYITDGTGSTIAALWTHGIGTTDYTWYETTVDTTGHAGPYTVALYAYGLPSTSYICYDGILIGKSIEIGGAEVIDTVDCTAAISFTYTPDQDYTSDVVTVDFTTIDMGDYRHGAVGAVYAQVGTTPVTAYIGGSKLYIDGVTMSSGVPYNFYAIVPFNLPPSLISPTNGSTITFTSVSMTTPVTFTWEDTRTTCKIQVSEDAGFSNVVYEHETNDDTATASLLPGTFYWRVLSYDSVYGVWSSPGDTYNFVTVSSASSISGTGIAGFVYESLGLGQYNDLAGASVTVYNETYSVSKVTGAAGYYQVLGLSSGVYYVIAEKEGYDDSIIAAVNVTAGSVKVQYIPLMQSPSYFAPHYVKIKVYYPYNIFGVMSVDRPAVGAKVSIYENSDTAAAATQLTGSDGACGFSMSENVRYRIVVTYGAITQTEYVSPVENEYLIHIESGDGNGLLPESQFYEVCNITIDKTQLNSSVAKIDITYTDNENVTDSVYFEIGQELNNGTFVAVDTSAVFTGNATCSLYVDNYRGESYTVIAHVVHDSFGTITKYFTVAFSGSNLPFTGKAMGYLGVVILFVVFAMWGKYDVAQGSILSVGLGWFLWYLDIFACFGTATNALMGAGLLLGTLLAVMHNVNKKRDEGGI